MCSMKVYKMCVCLTLTPAVCRPPQRRYRPTGRHKLCPTVLHDTLLLCPHMLMDHQRDVPGQTLKLNIHTHASFRIFSLFLRVCL